MNQVEVNTATHVRHQQALLVILREFDRVCRSLNIPYVLFAGTMLGAVRHQGFIPWDDDLDVLMLRADYERFLKEAGQLLDSDKFYLQKEFSEHWPMFFSKLRLNGTTCLEKYHVRTPHHQGVYIDIFPCDNAAKSNFGRKVQYYASKIVIAKSLDQRGYDTNSRVKRIFMGMCRLMPMKPFWAITKMGRNDSKMVHSFFGGARNFTKNVYPRKYFTERLEAEFEGACYPISESYDELLTLLYGDYMRLPPPEERAVKQHAILVDTENSYEMYADHLDEMTFDIHTRSIR